MEQLSSCYFCGAALDASLDEYPVIPKELHPDPDEQRTVVLCQGCRQKLGTVVETVVGAIDTESPEPRDAAAGASRESAGDAVDAGAAPVGDATAADATAADDEDEWVPSDALPDEGAPATGDADPSSADENAAAADTSSTAANPDPLAGNDGESAAETESAAGADSSPESQSQSESPSAGDDSAGYSSGRSAGNTTTDGPDDAGPSLTALEYNKVMRLLQNREFPVDQAEIKEVAVNAYDISESEFDAIIGAAVDKDLIGEENGKFVEAS